MFKKFLSGVLAAALLLGGATYANTTTADAAAKVPAPKYNFNMDKANKNVVAVARKGDTTVIQQAILRQVYFLRHHRQRKLSLNMLKARRARLFT